MERVAFLLVTTGERLICLLNPESLMVRRAAGLRRRRSIGGMLTGTGVTDDPLLHTGGGSTELHLDLLFDVSLAGSSVATEDVRDLTRSFWDLAENAVAEGNYGRLPLVRFVWGKSWNIPGVVASIAERLEFFTERGVPQRSWLRMKFLRVSEPSPRSTRPETLRHPVELPREGEEIPAEQVRVREMTGADGGMDGRNGGWGGRLDIAAYEEYGDPSFWRLIAAFNDLNDPMRVPVGSLLRMPPAL